MKKHLDTASEGKSSDQIQKKENADQSNEQGLSREGNNKSQASSVGFDFGKTSILPETTPNDGLPRDLQSNMENSFGTDFSNVKIHKNSNRATELNALAFTQGENVHFAPGEFNPNSKKGRELIGHEFTHVVQQRSGVVNPTSVQEKGINLNNDKGLEVAADSLGEKAVNGVEINQYSSANLKSQANANMIQQAPIGEEEEIANLKANMAVSFGLKAVEDGDEKWSLADLKITNDAMKMIPAVEKSALKNLVIIRVKDLGGKTAGKFSSSQGLENKINLINYSKIELEDSAFAGTDDLKKKQVVIHEVGHALASETLRKANTEQNLAQIEFNKKALETQASKKAGDDKQKEVDVAFGIYKKKEKEYNDAATASAQTKIKPDLDRLLKIFRDKEAERDKISEKNKTQNKEAQELNKVLSGKKKVVEESKISNIDLAVIKASASTADSAHTKSLDTTKSKVTAAMKQGAEASAYYSALEAASTAITDFYNQSKTQDKEEKVVDSLISTVNTVIKKRDRTAKKLNSKDSGNSLQPVTVGLEKSQNNFFKAAKSHSLAKNRKKRVQNFVEFVDSKKIAPITDYAKDNWPQKPEEFYAEAYSFWVTKKLAAKSAELDKWFTAGKHRKN